MSNTPPPRPRSDWRVFVYLAGGSAVTLSDGLEESEAREVLKTANKMLADNDAGLTTGTLGGTRGAVRLSAVEAVGVKDFRAVGR